MNSLFNILLSALIGFVYLKIMSLVFKKSVMYMKEKSRDFLVQILLGWLLIMLSSSWIYWYAPPYLTYYYIMQTIMYTAMVVCIMALFLLLVVKPISINKYNRIVVFIKKDFNRNES
ncbi:hypothetical protein T479_12905 [Lysinibacillus varians]|nr:hypothetical protein T479_12905 [Lysinibacillus varians]